MPVTGTHGRQQPYGIQGTVTINGTATQGAMVWVFDFTEGTKPAPVDDKTSMYTNASGKYSINLAGSTEAYSDGDTVRVYCRILGIDKTQFSDVTVNKQAGFATVNFTVVKRSGTTAGCTSSPILTGLKAGKGQLYKETDVGCMDGLT